MTVELYPEQMDAVNKLSTGKILCGLPGSGKSITAMYYFWSKVCGGVVGDYGSLTAPRDLYIITTARKRDTLDWEEEALKFGISKHDRGPGGIKMTVDSWNNIGKYKDVKDAFFIFDEQRVVGSGAWAITFVKVAKQNDWILLSGTPGDTWLDYIPVFVANGWYKNRTEFKREHVVYASYVKFPKVERYLKTHKLMAYRRHVLVQMPVKRHTIWHKKRLEVDFDKELFDYVKEKRWHVYEERPLKGISELFHVLRRVVTSHESRPKTVRRLLETHPRLIVFYNFDHELEALRAEFQSSEISATQESMSGSQSISDPDPSTTSPLTGTIWDPEWDEKAVMEKLLAASPSTSKPATDRATIRMQSGPMGVPGRLLTGISGSTTPTNLTDGSTPVQSQAVPELRGGTKSDVVFAEWNGHKHQEVPDSESWVYAVQYTAGSEAWNCITTNAVCMYSLTYSYKQFAQAHGRIDRLNTKYTHLHAYYLVSKSWLEKGIWDSLSKKKNFTIKDLTSKVA